MFDFKSFFLTPPNQLEQAATPELFERYDAVVMRDRVLSIIQLGISIITVIVGASLHEYTSAMVASVSLGSILLFMAFYIEVLNNREREQLCKMILAR